MNRFRVFLSLAFLLLWGVNGAPRGLPKDTILENALGEVSDWGPQAPQSRDWRTTAEEAQSLATEPPPDEEASLAPPPISFSYRIDTVAGTSERGDGGPADQARLDFPSSVAVDGAGNLFIADTYNHRIRVLTPTLDFAHFANGASVSSDLVLMNVEAVTVYPTLYFYDSAGAVLDAESVVEVGADLET